MATAKARGRRRTKSKTRLVEKQTEEALRLRTTELIGLVLLGLGVLFCAMLWSYNPKDPSFFSATTQSPQNMLGIVGASIADPLHRAVGLGSWGIPIAFFAWGMRLLRHRGDGRILSRAILIPIAIALSAAFAAGHIPIEPWPYPYGIGGVFGDIAFVSIVSMVPASMKLTVMMTTLLLGLLTLFFAFAALGMDWPEFKSMTRFLGRGLVHSYAALLVVGGFVGSTLVSAIGGARARQAARKEERARKIDAANKAEPSVNTERSGAEPRMSDSENEDRVMARITEAVRKRESTQIARVTDADDQAVVAPSIDVSDRMEPDVPPLKEAGRIEPRVQQPSRKAPKKSERAKKEEQPSFLENGSDGDFEIPALSLLESPTTIVRHTLSDEALEQNARMLETVLDDYGVKGEIVSVRPGPVVTMYELEPAPGVKASRVIGLSDDIARSMSALAARVSTVPGRSVIGIELPNEHREKVLLREILSGQSYGDGSHSLPLALGKDISGEAVVANLARMPHLLIAGTTGSGKSVAINTMILSLLYKLTPEECRLIMIDPKMLELSVYDGIPHLLSPVVTDPKKAVVALKWVVAEMEERYRKMSKMGVRNIDGYNSRVKDALDKGEAFSRTVQTGFDDETGEPVFESEDYAPEKMAYIVVIVDEMADLMMVAGKEIEACIQRLAQMARASGIHLIMATQRPSVDVITGTIKANFPTRISFQVTSKIDSRTILGEQGAEQLLGMGDMLYMAGGGRITRVHGPFVSDEEVEEVVTHLKRQGSPDYVSGVQEGPDAEAESEIDLVLGLGGNTNGENALYDQAVAIVARDRKCSTSYIQRKLGIGYNKAARLVEQMEDEGVVSRANHVGKREIMLPETG